MKRNLPIILCLAASLLMLAGACRRTDTTPQTAEPLSVTLQLSTNRIHVGDPVAVTLDIVHPKGGVLHIPSLAQGKEIITRDQKSTEEALPAERTRTRHQAVITSLTVGNHTLTTGEVTCTTADGTVLRQPMPFASLEVASLLTGEDTPFQDIKGLARWPALFPRWVLVLLLVAVLAFITALLVRRFLSKPRTILHHPPPPPPHETALRALRTLLAKGWIEALNVEPFYVELSGIVRHYLEDRFHLRAPELTTEEFIREATSSQLLSPAHQALTSGFLEQSDLVKFARHRPTGEDMKAAYSAAETLVRETIPAPAIPSGRAGT